MNQQRYSLSRSLVFFSIRQKLDDRTNSKGGCNYGLARPMNKAGQFIHHYCCQQIESTH